MLSLTIIIGVLFGGLVYIFNYFRSQLIDNRDINKLPGPSGLQLLWQMLGPNSHCDKFNGMIAFNEKYGSIVKLWVKPFKPAIMVADTELMDKILTSKDHLVKTQMYDLLKPYIGEGLATTSNANVWRQSRKICNTAFQHNTVTGFLPIFQKNMDVFLETLKSETGKPVDTQHVIHLFTLDIIFESLMKQRFGFQEANNPIYINARVDYFSVLTERLYSVLLMNDWIFRFSKHFKKMEGVVSILKKFTLDVVTKAETARKDGVVIEKPKIHLIDILIDNNLSAEILNDQINTFILAGHDTVAQAMSFTLYELSRRSVIQQKLLEEIQSIVGKDSTAEITYKDLQEMKYLEAIVKESLRLHVIVPIIERKISYAIEHNGIRYPKDTTFMFNIDGIHKSEKYFPNPKEYDPNRFMPENAHRLRKNSFIPFSVGPRDCIGKLYAMLEIKLFVAKCIQKFEVLPVENHTLKMLSEIVNKSITGMPVIFKERAA